MSGANSFESVAKNLPKIKEVLQNASNQKLRNSICDDKFKIILDALIEILIPFRVATETLERQKQITCHPATGNTFLRSNPGPGTVMNHEGLFWNG